MNMKRVICIAFVSCTLFATVVYAADVTLSILVPDAYVDRLLAAINKIADKEITMLVKGNDPNGQYAATWTFTIEGKQGGETDKQWGQRYAREMLKASMRLYEYRDSEITREAAIAALPAADVNVPDDAIQ